MFFSKLMRNREFKIIVVVLAIMVIGMIALSSASYPEDSNFNVVKKQGISIIVGIIACLVVASIDYETYSRFWYVFYAISLIMLILVLFTDPINHARSWFKFFNGRIAFQPSEITKIVLILAMARLLTDFKKRSFSAKDSFIRISLMVILIGVPLFLILKQPDFGTAMVVVASVFAMIFVWGIDYKYIRIGIIISVIVAPFAYIFGLSPVQKDRIKVFFNPNLDPKGAGYHVIQSKLAVGAGKFSGMGLFNGTQTQRGYLFAQTTDFIFAAIAEEMGFVIAAILIVLLTLLVINSFMIAKDARDEEGRLIAVGLGTMFAFHIFINVGMTMGVAPITGIPLPFVSYGGSAMLTNMVALGILLGISIRKTGLRF